LEAEVMYRKTILIHDGYEAAHHNLGVVLKDLGRLDEAELCYRRALELKPDYAEAYSSLLFTLNYHPDKSSEAIFAAYQEYDQRFCVPLRDQWRPFNNTPDPQHRLRVGYVSPDFRICSARHFLEPLLANHDKSAVEVFAYAQLAVEDQMTAVYKGYVDHWVPTFGMSDTALVERIRADRIDILIDTAGHSANHRLGVFARKPAPVSLSWLGFGYTTGLSAVDYYLTDEMAAPPGSEHLFSETCWPLDPIAYVYRPAQGMGEINPLPALSRGHVTFGTLTRSVRINHRTIRVWAQILQQVPNARLVIDSGSYKEVPMQDSLAALFATHGIGRDRLEIGCHSPWDALRGIDIGLDCFPHNSGTTLFETLYMGIPFITLGDRPSMGRLGSSILRALGRSEWVAKTEEEYVRKAVALAGDLPALASNRANQRGQMAVSPLMDEPTFARKVESAYRMMFRRWCDLNT
jgi:predicted O-linked N-acetylglucosamine transferase (SPINDLY family)